MKNRHLILTVAFVCLTAFGFATVWANEIYIVAADEYGNSYYMELNDTGTLSGQTLLANTGYIPHANGMGDFDNDGD
jgi:hypothetical protein